jgi:putative redox protein
VKATATRTAGYTHRIEIRNHQLTVDEPQDQGGDDRGPTPQELLAAGLAACTAITIEMYAERKGWDIGEVAVECEYEQTERNSPTEFKLTLRLPGDLNREQLERLQAIAAKCPVHRALEGKAKFHHRAGRL